MKSFQSILTILLTSATLSAQMVTLSPSNPSGDDEITVTFDANQGNGELVGAAKVYLHSGVVLDAPDGTAWNNAIGNWGMDDGVGQMTKVEGTSDKWEIKLTPTARQYYGVDASETIFRLAMVFRNADGSKKGTAAPGTYDWGFVAGNQDIYVNLDAGFYVSILSPADDEVYLAAGEALKIEAEASAEVSTMTLAIDEGQGFEEVANVSSGTTISYDYSPAQSMTVSIKVSATISGQSVENQTTATILLRQSTPVAALPVGAKKGINYVEGDPTSAILVLEAPGKDFAYVVGDFNNWTPGDNYLMNQTADGELFWYELNGLTAGEEYVFQYWVDGTIKIGDPYADKVADPWNDQYIPASLYPNPTGYDKTDYQMATILQTGQEPYVWAETESTWSRPVKENLVVYELLVRDFLGSHSYQDLADTLGYLKRIGVNAIELMPIMEFEGNESWGYNPVYYFAPDKYYGTKNDLKHFIETAHQEGFAVILDMVLNHAYGQCPLVKLYWDETLNAPANNSPWFNQVAKHPFNVGYDFNHSTTYTQNFMDSVNNYWINEYHFDGYRFDLSKGFTQNNTGDDVGAWGQYDPGRISILKRMNNEIKAVDAGAYVILEHFADTQEETELGNAGMLLWRNVHGDFDSALKGNARGISGAASSIHVSYMESHDEERQMVGMLTGGIQSGNYDVKNVAVALERAKMGAAFLMVQKGPKMMWQFGELGYDVSINFNGRVGNKPLPWGSGNLGLYEDPLRQYLYDAYAAINDLRTSYPLVFNAGDVDASLGGKLKSIAIQHGQLNVVVIGNFGAEEDEITYDFPSTGAWFDYFGGDEFSVTSAATTQSLKPGEFYIYTNKRVSEGFPGVVEIYENPVTVSPSSFGLDDEITITFDATKASKDGTAGLVGASKVFMNAGLVVNDPKGTDLSHKVEDGSGEMTKVDGEDNQWKITITPRTYFGLGEDATAFRLGMHFRDEAGQNVGKGFRDELIFLGIQSDVALVTFDPAEFFTNQEVSLIFDASLGDQGLLNATKIYAHSGTVLTPGDNPSFGSNVVGNWGADDGAGQMTKIAGTNKWELKYTPSLRDYYGLSATDSVYWISVVFRNADGSVKGSGPAGDFNGGFIAANGDIYLKVTPPEEEEILGVKKEHLNKVHLFPNPTTGQFRVGGEVNTPYNLFVFDLSGRMLSSLLIQDSSKPVDLSHLREGQYLIQVVGADQTKSLRLVILK
ncbi:MAG: alpha-amylase family glycosyl hydrolase [Marinoscillum sp.]|uniref:DUF4961 domain-containing protein n=2 Tax=Marinoscillum sp. TaxID=2024838 RepID=UPI0032F8D6CE